MYKKKYHYAIFLPVFVTIKTLPLIRKISKKVEPALSEHRKPDFKKWEWRRGGGWGGGVVLVDVFTYKKIRKGTVSEMLS